MNKRIWFLRHGNHLTRGLIGTASTEYGDKTYWLRLPFGILVVRGRRFTHEEVIAADPEDGDFVWLEYDRNREEGGVA